MKNEKFDSPEITNLRKEIKDLQDRLTAVELSMQNLKESNLNFASKKSAPQETEFEIKLPFQTEGSIESRVGEYGMAWLGNIVLLFGVTFLVQYLQNRGYSVFSFLTGFISIAAIFIAAHYSRKSLAYLSRLFSYNGYLLLFYFSVHLHFFESNPIIRSEIAGLILIFMVPIVLFIIAFRRKSQLMLFMAMVMFLISGIISNSTTIMAVFTAAVAIVSAYLFYRFSWTKLYAVFIFLIYLSHWVWLLNNPFLSNTMEFIATPGNNIITIFITGFAFSVIAFFRMKEKVSEDFVIASIIFNGLGFTSILLITTFTYYTSNYVLLYATITLFCLLFSVILKKTNSNEIIASMYALYGFLAMSVSFYGLYDFPAAYLFFSLQSLLVVSMALWFRSRFIVIMNTILYLILLVFYLKDKSGIVSTDFSFMLVAFITARIINWKKERLNIKTEIVRNLYLLAGFVMTLVAFYGALPSDYVTVSWIISAILFFVLSHFLKNIKYRWLAIATVIASAIKLLFIDMSNIDIGYRVLVFLGLAIISIIVSIFYTRYLKKRRD